MLDLDSDFKSFFPLLNFQLSDFQKSVIDHTIKVGSTLCIMPTGGGKSVIYWMTAAELGGTSIVISPLTALIAEQADKIRAHGFEVLEVHGGVDAKKQYRLLRDFANGQYTPDFIFLSPEKIATDGFLEYCIKCRQTDVKLIVIDEVHCVSQWGISFRPFYKRIPDFLNIVFGRPDLWCRVLALTATLNPKELGDICSSFHIQSDSIIKKDLLMRSEIQLHVQEFANETLKEERFWEIVNMHRDEKILVYVYRKMSDHGVEGLCESAIERGYNAAFFHGDMTSKERMAIIDQYREGKVNLIFATNAFGMGIDIPDIQVVIHYMLPESAEQYYQEIGRAARNHQGANAYLLYSNKNIEVKHSYFIEHSFPDEKKLVDVYQNFGGKIGVQAIMYFSNEELQECLPYYEQVGLVQIIAKGFPNLSTLHNITDSELLSYYNCTKNKLFGLTLKKSGVSPNELTNCVYRSIVNGTAECDKIPSGWIIVRINAASIDDESMAKMQSIIAEKKQYKHELLDYFVYIIKNNPDNLNLHQEIALYLGMDKHQLARIHETADGNHVRSKSEVIICNLLYEAGIAYEYEAKLFYSDGKWIEPDFTLHTPLGRTLFWEHVGLLGKEDYDANWKKKLDIYEQYFPNQMIKTYESGALSRDAKTLISKIKDD